MIPRRLRRVRCREAVLRHAAMLIDLGRTDTNRGAGRLALTFLRIELAIDEDNAITDNLPAGAHFSDPFFSASQTS